MTPHSHTAAPAQSSPSHPHRLAEQVVFAYQSLGPDNLEVVQDLYADDVWFADPAHDIRGKQNLMAYFAAMFKNLDHCSFEIHDTLTDGDGIFMTWTMLMNHPRLRGGETVRVDGASFLKTRDGKVHFHRDYFDLGAMLYENLPLLGRLILKIKQNLGR